MPKFNIIIMKKLFFTTLILTLTFCSQKDKVDVTKSTNADLHKTWILISNNVGDKIYYPSLKTFAYPIKLEINSNNDFSIESCGIKNGRIGLVKISSDSIDFKISSILDYARPDWEYNFEENLNKLKYTIHSDTLKLIISNSNYFNLIDSAFFNINNYKKNIPSDTTCQKESC